MIQAEKIADVLGIDCKIHSLYDLSESVERGLPKKSLLSTVKRLTVDSKVAKEIQNKLVPPASYNRRVKLLNAQESERVERLARVYAIALDVWGNKDDARQFLFTPHPMMSNKRPIDISYSDLGARQVEIILDSIRYGLPA